MYKKTKFISLFIIVLICLFTFSGCGGSSTANSVNSLKENTFGSVDSITNESGIPSDLPNSGNSSANAISQKIIKNYFFDIESVNFDKTINDLELAVSNSEGYIKESNIVGNKLSYKSLRSAEYVISIPTEKTNSFLDYINDNFSVSNKSITTEDITSQYIDVESRLSALRAEKEVLESLLKEAAVMDDIIKIREQLTEVIYEIESFEAKKRTYDSLVDYATIEITIKEVEQTKIAYEEKTVWQKIGAGFVDNLNGVTNFLVECFIFLISSIPCLALIAIVTFLFIVIFKMFFKKKKNKKKQSKQE